MRYVAEIIVAFDVPEDERDHALDALITATTYIGAERAEIIEVREAPLPPRKEV